MSGLLCLGMGKTLKRSVSWPCKLKMKLIVAMFCLLISLTATAAQTAYNLFSRVDQVFEQTEPAWKVERVYPNNTSDPVEHNVVYRSKMGQASIGIRVLRREEDAR